MRRTIPVLPYLAAIAVLAGAASGTGARYADPVEATSSVVLPARLAPTAAGPSPPARALQAMAAVPLHFERNDGQVGEAADFLARGAGYRVSLDRTGPAITLSRGKDGSPSAVRFELRGSAATARGTGVAPLPGVVNYITGADPQRWRMGVPTFSRVTYHGVYDGIDVAYYGNQQRLQYDFIVAPGADPARIAFDVRGATSLDVGDDGALRIVTPGGTIEHQRPFTYQQMPSGERREVPSRFRVDGHTVGFEIGAYDATRELVIDPVLTYSSWFGGRSQEQIAEVTVDASGNILVTGNSADRDGYPTTAGALRTSRGGDLQPTDTFVANFSPSGATLLFSTLLGGSDDDTLVGAIGNGGIAAAPNGNVVVVGHTKSSDFPTTPGADDTTFNSLGAPIVPDAFMTILSSTGALVYSTYLGGTDVDFAINVAVDAAGKIYVVGVTRSSVAEGFPITATTYDGVLGGSNDAFMARYSSAGAREYLTYIGGSGTEYFNPNVDVVVDQNNIVVVAGETTSSDFPTLNGFQTGQGGGGTAGDGFLVKINTTINGSGALLYGTLWGGSQDESFTGIARDSAGKVYISGWTRSTNVTTTVVPGGAAPTLGNFDAMVWKFDTSLAGASSLVYAFRLSGTGTDTAEDVTVDSQSRAWVVGSTSSTNFVLKNAFDTTPFVTSRPFVAELNTAGSDVLLTSYAGVRNTNNTTLASVKATAADEILMAGHGSQPAVNSNSLQLVNAYQTLYGNDVSGDGGDSDGVLQKLGPSADLSLTKSSASTSPATVLPGASLTYTITLTNNGPDGALSAVVTDTLPSSVTVTGCTATAGGVCGGAGNARTVTFASLANGASATITFTTTVGANVFPGTQITNTATVSAGSLDTVPANNTASTSIFVPTLTDRTADADNDGLPNGWEQDFGLNPLVPGGDNGPAGDPDADGKTNLQEYQNGTHPRGFVITYLAEGATGPFFDTRLAIANPTASPSLVLTRFQKTDGTTVRDYRTVNAMSRATIDVETLAGLDAAEFSTLVEADVQVVVDRTLTWDDRGYGSHAERGILTRTATEWYFAEGATHSGFNLFYLIQNPNEQAANVEVRYLRPPPAAPLVKNYTVPAQARFNIWVNSEAATDPTLAGLAASDVSVVMRSLNNVPIIAERALYRDLPGETFGIGHESAGVTAPATNWFLAEGSTGTFMDMFVLLANPNNATADVTVEYLLPSGQMSKTYQVAPNSRYNIWVDLEQFPDGSGNFALANTAVSAAVTSTNNVPIIVERAMYWPGPSYLDWREAHNSPGSTVTGTLWALAEGETGGSRSTETYVLVANTSTFAGQVKATVLFEDGTAPVEKTFPALAAKSRFNIVPASDFPTTAGKRYGMIVESIGASPIQIVVERAMYSNSGGVTWAAGTNALATRLQ